MTNELICNTGVLVWVVLLCSGALYAFEFALSTIGRVYKWVASLPLYREAKK